MKLVPGPYTYDSRTISSQTINDLEEYSKYVPGPYLKSTLRLEQCAFQIWPWNIFDLQNSFSLLMVQDHMVLEHMAVDHKLRPKSPQSVPYRMRWIQGDLLNKMLHFKITFPLWKAIYKYSTRGEWISKKQSKMKSNKTMLFVKCTNNK